MKTGRIEIIGENYQWHEITAHIIHKTTQHARPDSDYTAKVDVYEDRVKGWFLDVVEPHVSSGSTPGDYIAVMVALGYIEGVEQYRKGGLTPRFKSAEWFETSARRIFPEVSDDAIKRLWTDVRNGMFHDGFTKEPTLLSHDECYPICISDKFLKINPMLFLKRVIIDFEQYILDLREYPNDSIAHNFSQYWDAHWNNT